MKTLLRNQKGFTLIELMIVVGIIGILAAIAIPNFERFQSKARQSEAKIALAAIYGGEKAFYSEYSAYISSLDAIGYSPEGLKRFYSVGFRAAHSGTVTGYAGGVSTPWFIRTNVPSAWTTCTDADSTNNLPVGLSGDDQTMTAGASGQIRNSISCDVWTMDELKQLSNSTINL